MHFNESTTVRTIALPILMGIATVLFFQGIVFTPFTFLFSLCTIVFGVITLALFVYMVKYLRDEQLVMSVMKTAEQLLQAYHDLGSSFDVFVGSMRGPLVRQEGGRCYLSVRAHDGVEYRDYVITDSSIGMEYRTYSATDGTVHIARSFILESDEVEIVRDCLQRSLMAAQNLLDSKERTFVSA